MKIAIMGAGGVGGFYGGRMARAGLDVTFIARGAHLEALRTQGLKIISPTLGEFHLPQVNATDDPAEVGPVDVVWMTVKSYGLAEAARSIQPLVAPETLVIPLLNGVDAAEEIGKVVGPEHMAGGVVYVSAFIETPGVIRHVVADRLVFGELAGGGSDRLAAVKEELGRAGIEAELSENIQLNLWEKYCGLAASAAVAAASRADSGTVRAEPELVALHTAAMGEIRALAQAQGIDLGEDAINFWAAMRDKSPPEVKPSMLLDLERGKPLELESVLGAAVRMGRELSVPTPVLTVLYAVLKPYADGTDGLGSV